MIHLLCHFQIFLRCINVSPCCPGTPSPPPPQRFVCKTGTRLTQAQASRARQDLRECVNCNVCLLTARNIGVLCRCNVTTQTRYLFHFSAKIYRCLLFEGWCVLARICVLCVCKFSNSLSLAVNGDIYLTCQRQAVGKKIVNVGMHMHARARVCMWCACVCVYE